MVWQIVLAISIAAEVFGRLLHRVLMQEDKSDPIAYAIVYQLIAGMLLGVFALIRGFSLPSLEPILFNLLLMPFLWAISNILIFRALKVTEASIFTILFTTNAIWVILGAIFFFGESFLLRHGIGAILVFLAIVLISWKHQNIKFRRAEAVTLFAAFVFGVALLNDTYIVRTFDVLSYLSIAFIIPALTIWAFYPASTKQILAISKSRIVLKLASLAVFYATAGLGYYYAYVFGRNAAQITSIFQVATVLTVLAAVFLLKETSHLLLKIIAAVISFVGVLLLR